MSVGHISIGSRKFLASIFDLIKISRTAFSVAILVSTALPAQAFNATDLKAIVSLQKCNNCDLSGAHLEELILQDMELAGANLSGAFLAKVNFEFSDMKGANLAGADLTKTRLVDVYFVRANLTNANLTEAYLSGANFLLADLTGANFTDAEWPDKADFTLAKFCKTTWVDGSIKNKDC